MTVTSLRGRRRPLEEIAADHEAKAKAARDKIAKASLNRSSATFKRLQRIVRDIYKLCDDKAFVSTIKREDMRTFASDLEAASDQMIGQTRIDRQVEEVDSQ